MKTLIFAVLSVAVCAPIFAEVAAEKKSSHGPLTQAERARRMYERTGGFLPVPGSQKGRILYINKQTRVAESDLAPAFATMQHDARFNFAFGKEGEKGDVVIEIIDDAAKPALLVAPEDSWAQLNVAKLAVGLSTPGAIKKFLASRVRKEMMRAFAYAGGSGGTQYPNNVLAISKVQDLDFCEEFIPMDAVNGLVDRLGRRGVTVEKMATYRKACHDGWAPAPTNDVQKAVAAKVKEQMEKEKAEESAKK